MENVLRVLISIKLNWIEMAAINRESIEMILKKIEVALELSLEESHV